MQISSIVGAMLCAGGTRGVQYRGVQCYYAWGALAKSHPMDAAGSKNIYWVDDAVCNQIHGLYYIHFEQQEVA